MSAHDRHGHAELEHELIRAVHDLRRRRRRISWPVRCEQSNRRRSAAGSSERLAQAAGDGARSPR